MREAVARGREDEPWMLDNPGGAMTVRFHHDTHGCVFVEGTRLSIIPNGNQKGM